MDVTVAILILTAGFVAERFILNRARMRAERESVVIARLAHYAGRRAE